MNGFAPAIIFDVEGTLIDCASLVLHCWQKTLAARGFAFNVDELHPYSGMDATLMLSALLPGITSEEIQSLLNEQGRRYRAEFLPQAKPFPGARELFADLASRGHVLALATTSMPDELRHYLRLLDITEFVTAAVCGNDVSKEKPAPDLISAAMHKLPGAPHEVLSVGDTPMMHALPWRPAPCRMAC